MLRLPVRYLLKGLDLSLNQGAARDFVRVAVIDKDAIPVGADNQGAVALMDVKKVEF